ncbi:MAG: 1-acyl-sn-glycerol-3-phosphate acyltransferase [Phycisphaeraceae bacterium]|nr:1-acyl-sn-glycerol-3-phosphate acyltransferase [Phycisphaeraceae bacterium]
MQSWEYKPAKDSGLPMAAWTRSLGRESGLLSTVGHLGWRVVVRTALRGLHRLQIEGKRNIPHALPMVVISNHASHLDALVLSSLLPLKWCDHVFPVAAGDVFFETPRVSWFAAVLINALPMWRKSCGRHALADLRQRLVQEPCGYILFPEGKRSADGQLQPFKPGIGMMVAGTAVPVVPCHIQGAFEALPRYRRLPRFNRLRVRIGQPLVFVDVPNDHEGWQHICAELERAVKELQRPEPGV